MNLAPPNITGQLVKAAAMTKNITYIPIRQCSICEADVAYRVYDGRVYFDPNCRCGRHAAELQPREWTDAADWINSHIDPQARRTVLAQFGFDLESK